MKLLNTELEKFNDFFMEKEEEFVIRMGVVREQIERLVCEACRQCALLAFAMQHTPCNRFRMPCMRALSSQCIAKMLNQTLVVGSWWGIAEVQVPGRRHGTLHELRERSE